MGSLSQHGVGLGYSFKYGGPGHFCDWKLKSARLPFHSIYRIERECVCAAWNIRQQAAPPFVSRILLAQDLGSWIRFTAGSTTKLFASLRIPTGGFNIKLERPHQAHNISVDTFRSWTRAVGEVGTSERDVSPKGSNISKLWLCVLKTAAHSPWPSTECDADLKTSFNWHVWNKGVKSFKSCLNHYPILDVVKSHWPNGGIRFAYRGSSAVCEINFVQHKMV